MAIRPEIALEIGKVGQGGPDIGAAVERGLRLQQLAMQPALLQQELLNRQQQEQLLREQVISQRAGQELTGAQVRASEAGTALTKTQTEAEAERVRQEKVKAEDAERRQRFMTQWLPENQANFRDANGRIDVVKLTESATNAGFAVPALEFQGAHLQNLQREIQNATSETDRQAKLTGYRNEAQAMIANQIHSAIQAGVSDDQLQKVLDELARGIDSTMPDVKIGSQIASTLMTPDKNGVLRIDRAKVNGARTAGMTVAQQESNNIAKREMALRELQATPEYQNRIAGIPNAQLSSGLIDTATQISNSANLLQTGIRGIDGLKTLPGRPGAIASAEWNRLVAQGGPHAQVQAAIDEYNRNLPPGAAPIKIEDGLDAIRGRILTQISSNVTRAENLRGMAGAADMRTYQPIQNIPIVRTDEEYDALPKGARFMTQNGVVREKGK